MRSVSWLWTLHANWTASGFVCKWVVVGVFHSFLRNLDQAWILPYSVHKWDFFTAHTRPLEEIKFTFVYVHLLLHRRDSHATMSAVDRYLANYSKFLWLHWASSDNILPGFLHTAASPNTCACGWSICIRACSWLYMKEIVVCSTI